MSTGHRRPPIHLGWLLGGVSAVAAYYLMPLACVSPAGQGVWYCLISFGSAVAVLAGPRLHRPQARAAWWLLGAGQIMFTLGDIAYTVITSADPSTSYPLVANLFYLAQYPLVAAALALLIRRRSTGNNATAFIDAGTVATGAALLWWTYLIQPIVTAPGVSTPDRFAATAYPVMDLAVLAVALRLVLGGGRHTMSFHLLTGFLALTLLADTVYGLQTLLGEFVNGSWLDALWLAGYVLLGAAALHPSMRRIDEPGPVNTESISRWRLGLLTAAVMVVPAVLVVENLRGTHPNLLIIAAACTVLFLLVLTRMAGLVSAQRHLAITDELTGLHTRRFLQERLEAPPPRPRRDGEMGLLIVDVDHFKQVNDAYGHPAGDQVLIEVARRLEQACRRDDVIARFGGEEFAILAADVTRAELRELAERVRHTVVAEPVPVATGVDLKVTVSLGGATAPRRISDSGELVRVADAALYAAKNAGRDRAVLAAPS
ncbi:diguanylate cyclase [Actinoplanes sp. NPDC049681]|uniref:diguanylate cyclase n=1 Tax=Actinoplanes sp. NPDC049681 TaxID=3363905 RepID=UPI00379DA179